MTYSKCRDFRALELPPDLLKQITESGVRSHRLPGGLLRQIIIALVLAAGVTLAAIAAPPNAPYQQALRDFQSGKFKSASATLEANGEHTVDSELLLARCYKELGNWDRAAAHAEAAIRMDAGSSEAHLLLGEADGRKAESQHSLTLAIQTRREFERAVALAPANIDARRDLLQYYLSAPWILGGGKDKARREAREIASLDPVEGALARARVDESTGEAAKARDEYSRVLSLKPRYVGPYLESADFYVKTSDVSGLKAAITGADHINAGDVRLAYYRGVARVLEGQRLKQAEHDLKTYISASPKRQDYPSPASALNWLGRLYERLGQPNLAMIEYEAALQLDPGIIPAREALDRLQTSSGK